MKPVMKGNAPNKYAQHGDAKPDLIDRIGQQCSYCEAPGSPQNLHVEHIYPKDPHPERETDWENFLIACSTCNTYKHHHLGSGRRRGLEKRYLWPHLDNTFSAFIYLRDGRVEIDTALSPDNQRFANAIREMAGILMSPAKAKKYAALGIAYDGVDKRKEFWKIAISQRDLYLQNPTPEGVASIALLAPTLGYFSIWMKAFENRPEVRQALIQGFKADSQCFDANACPLKKGRV